MTNKRVQYTEGTASQPFPNPTTGLQYLRRNAGNTAWELVTVTPGGGTASLGTTLAIGNTTDGYDIILSVGDALTSADGYVNISGHLSVSNGIDASNKKITSAAEPTSAQDVSTKNYVDTHIIQLTSSAPADVDKSAAVVGTATTSARADHKHNISTASAGSIGASNTEGSATTLARSDHTHAVTDLRFSSQAKGDVLYFNGLNWVVLAPGADGYVLTTHSTGQNPTWEQSAGGTSVGSTAPLDVTKSTALAGTSSFAAKIDHKHNVSTATAVSVGATNAEGTSTSLARADHTHAVTDLSIASEAKGDVLYFNGTNWVRLAAGTDGYQLTTHSTGQNPTWEYSLQVRNVLPASITKSSALSGTSAFAAKEDHKHDVSTAVAVSIGNTNAEGTATTLARSDHTHAVTDLSITSEVQGSVLYFNGSNWVQLAPGQDGYVLTTHSTGQNPTWNLVSSGGGNANLTNTPPVNVTKATAVVGTAIDAARADHKHDISTASASSIGASNAEGTSTSLARSDHTHSVTDLNIASQVQGSVLYFNGSNWACLAPSQDGYVLTTHSTGQNPSWTGISGGGSSVASGITNDSSVSGATVAAALNTLAGEVCARSGVTITGSFACAENLNTIASGNNSHAEGHGSESRGQASHAEGVNTLAVGVSSHVEGDTSRANAQNSHAEGSSTVADGFASHAEGDSCTATGSASHAEGHNSTSTSNWSHTEGSGCITNGLAAHAEGIACTAGGTGAHAEGFQTTAASDTSHAEGNASTANGTASHAEGYTTEARGNNSHASGVYSIAYGDGEYAHATGIFSTAGDNQYRRSQLKGHTDGSTAGETSVLRQGLSNSLLVLRPSTVYAVTVRAAATVMGLGSATRQAAFFYFTFIASVTSGGTVTISSVTNVITPIVQGAGFAGATLVPSTGGTNDLTLTFSIAGGLTVASRITATIEYVEVLGT